MAKERTEDLLVAKDGSANVSANPSGTTASQNATDVSKARPAASEASSGPGSHTANGPADASTGGNTAGPSGAMDGIHPPTAKSHPFDAQQSGTNVVFVLDRSLSMMGEKSVIARRELLTTLHGLGPNRSFYILLFPYLAMPANGPLPATDDNINSMGGWLYSVGHRIGSDPTKAMTRALQFNPDTVWLLSDGKFSASAAKKIRQANDLVNAKIHTVGFYSREGEAVLRRIAEENNGTYRYVPRPDEYPTNHASF